MSEKKKNSFTMACCFILKQSHEDITNLDARFDQLFQRQI